MALTGQVLRPPLPAHVAELPETWTRAVWNNREGRSLAESMLPFAIVVFVVFVAFSVAVAVVAREALIGLGAVGTGGSLLALAVLLPRQGVDLSTWGLRIRTLGIPSKVIDWPSVEIEFRNYPGKVEGLAVRNTATGRSTAIPNTARQSGSRDARAMRLEEFAEQLGRLASDAKPARL